MAEPTDPRVAVYIDFDNIVMSWYDRVHGRQAFSRDRQRIAADPTEPEIAQRLAEATIDVGALVDHAASFGSIMLTRAYADWSSPINAEYRSQLVARAVDLVQLFPAAAYAKNGADIRLAVDTVEDCFRIPDLTHIMIVSGDSDYVPLAQRCKRLGNYVAAVGVAGSSAKSLAAACDQFDSYEALPGIELPEKDSGSRPSRERSSRRAESPQTAPASTESAQDTEPGTAAKAAEPSTAPSRSTADAQDRAAQDRSIQDQNDQASQDQGEDERDQAAAGRLLSRALQMGERDDTDWLHFSLVKTYMRRMDPSFSEKALGYRSFSEFLKSHAELAEVEESGHERLVRAREVEKPSSGRSGRRRRG